jgi:hypothetical protein
MISLMTWLGTFCLRYFDRVTISGASAEMPSA